MHCARTLDRKQNVIEFLSKLGFWLVALLTLTPLVVCALNLVALDFHFQVMIPDWLVFAYRIAALCAALAVGIYFGKVTRRPPKQESQPLQGSLEFFGMLAAGGITFSLVVGCMAVRPDNYPYSISFLLAGLLLGGLFIGNRRGD